MISVDTNLQIKENAYRSSLIDLRNITEMSFPWQIKAFMKETENIYKNMNFLQKYSLKRDCHNQTYRTTEKDSLFLILEFKKKIISYLKTIIGEIYNLNK